MQIRLAFILCLICLFAACSTNSSRNEKSTSVSFVDSVINSNSLNGSDSVQIVAQRDTVIDGHKIHQSITLDYRQISDEKKKSTAYRDSIFLMRRVYYNPDTDKVKHIQNPFPELNDVYYPIHKFRGRYVLAQEGEAIDDLYYTFALVPKGFIISYMSEDRLFAFDSAHRAGSTVTYICSNGSDSAYVHIERPYNANHIQFWIIKTINALANDTNHLEILVIPMRYGLQLPLLSSGNDFGLDFDMDIPFDKMDWKAVMHRK